MTSPPGTVIGTVKQEWSLCAPKYTIRNSSDDVILRIEGPFCTYSMCGDVEFQVRLIGWGLAVYKGKKQAMHIWSGPLLQGSIWYVIHSSPCDKYWGTTAHSWYWSILWSVNLCLNKGTRIYSNFPFPYRCFQQMETYKWERSANSGLAWPRKFSQILITLVLHSLLTWMWRWRRPCLGQFSSLWVQYIILCIGVYASNCGGISGIGGKMFWNVEGEIECEGQTEDEMEKVKICYQGMRGREGGGHQGLSDRDMYII